MSAAFSIGAASARSGVKVPTIRYYESIGLVGAPLRTGSNRRVYGEEEVQRLVFIRHARDLGFEVEAIRTLIALQDQPDRSCAEADEVTRLHLADVEQRIARLDALRGELKRMLAQCPQDQVADCRIIETLNNHGLCAHGEH